MKNLLPPLTILTVNLLMYSCTSNTTSTHETKTMDKSKDYEYEIIGTKHNNAVENFFIFLKTKDLSEQSVEAAMMRIKSEVCTRQCNICAYDNKTYFYKENEYHDKEMELGQQLSNGQLTQAQWKKANAKLEKKYYVDLADHVVGFIEFEGGGTFSYYPYRDFKYKELGGKYTRH